LVRRVELGGSEGNRVDVSSTVWTVTLLGVVAVYLLDFVIASARPHVVSAREASTWVGVYVAAAIAFGGYVWATWGQQYGLEFYAGWLTEYSLSLDNLFVFVIILSSFAVPPLYQQKVLQIGILFALLLRFVFIVVGAAALEQFSWLFFLFGGFLLYTAYKLMTGHGTEEQPGENALLRLVRRVLPISEEYDEGRFFTRRTGRLMATPLLLVVVTLFLTDIMFALDSIPAIFGLTDEPYLVFTANAFALMGLRQLYFLLDGLLGRLIYLDKGLAIVLGFIGVKLILHAAHEAGADVPEPGIGLSLAVILGVLTVTVIWSLRAARRAEQQSAED
jgi:tellurite resistance protein TerC